MVATILAESVARARCRNTETSSSQPSNGAMTRITMTPAAQAGQCMPVLKM